MLTVKLPQIFQVHQVPRIFWEDGIMSGYRHPKSSALDCILSSFQMTNETINIWTHFLPTCCAHTFSTMSARARHVCYFCDYGALSLYSLGCAFAYGAYAMPERWVSGVLHRYFVPAAAFNSFVCTGLSCYSRFPELERPRLSKALRTAAFVYPFLYDNIPLFHRLLFCFGSDGACDEAVAGYCYHLVFALLTGFLFTSHLPERLAPGRFDYIGHSHQLFHVCAVLGTHFQLEAVLCDARSRRAWLRGRLPPPAGPGTFGTAGLALLGNAAIIGAFTAALPRAPGGSAGAAESRAPGAAGCVGRAQ
ncbi:membrane progestin receptor delta isoform X2 [Apteryx mantelli]|uniref:Membrane progestin receptor delta isoform X2 n=1 Tax=Apteryx mantelli TaxID=2696672 RepID=A0ABM4FWI2_9AVES